MTKETVTHDFTKVGLNDDQIQKLHQIGTRTFSKLAHETVETLFYVAGLTKKEAQTVKKNAKFMEQRT